MPDEEVRACLLKFKGIGEWTTDMFLIFFLGRMNVMPLSDVGIHRGFRRVYGLSRAPVREAISNQSERWKPYRSIASLYLWRIADTPIP